MLTVPQYGPPIDTLDEFAGVLENDSFQAVIFGRTTYTDYILQSKANSSVFATLARHLRRHQGSVSNKVGETFRLISHRRRYIAISLRIYMAIKRYSTSTVSLHIGSEHLMANFLAIIYPKSSPLTRPFNRL